MSKFVFKPQAKAAEAVGVIMICCPSCKELGYSQDKMVHLWKGSKLPMDMTIEELSDTEHYSAMGCSNCGRTHAYRLAVKHYLEVDESITQIHFHEAAEEEKKYSIFRAGNAFMVFDEEKMPIKVVGEPSVLTDFDQYDEYYEYMDHKVLGAGLVNVIAGSNEPIFIGSIPTADVRPDNPIFWVSVPPDEWRRREMLCKEMEPYTDKEIMDKLHKLKPGELNKCLLVEHIVPPFLIQENTDFRILSFAALRSIETLVVDAMAHGGREGDPQRWTQAVRMTAATIAHSLGLDYTFRPYWVRKVPLDFIMDVQAQLDKFQEIKSGGHPDLYMDDMDLAKCQHLNMELLPLDYDNSEAGIHLFYIRAKYGLNNGTLYTVDLEDGCIRQAVFN